MEEIKFRAWDKTERKMREVLNINFIHKDVWLKINEDKMIGANFFEIELLQYTGLKDKNGKEIYEGDIVRDFNGDIYEVIYDKYKFNLKDYYCSYFDNPNDGFSECSVEIVGNIYENPELLEEE